MISPCETFTCSDQGSCTYDEETQQVKCNCIEPYFGEHCEKHRCDKHICQNGGSCSFDEVLQQPKCSCIDPYIGDSCAINACAGIICRNGGTCIVENEAGKCDCIDHFFGNFCIQHPCDSFCQNNGTCTIKSEVPTCDCEVSYSGEVCECPPVYQKQEKGLLGKFLKKTGSEAKEHCSNLGGFLTFFINKEELDDYSNKYRVNEEHEWVGYTQKFPDDNDLYETADGEDARFMNWEASEPNNKNEHCVELYGKSNRGTIDHMNDLQCGEQLEFSCRFSQKGNCH